MSQWEITNGRPMIWNISKEGATLANRYWWVMTYSSFSIKTPHPYGPILVRTFDGMNIVGVFVPPHSYDYFNKSEKMEHTFCRIEDRHIWARIPFDDAPPKPNVIMEFNTIPWEVK
jgi:hypothetical protein